MQVRTGSKTGTLVLDINTGNSGIVITDAVNGQFQLAVDAVTTAALTASQFSPQAFYDLEIVDLSGVVTRLLEGTVRLSEEVTV